VTVKGLVDPITGMVINITILKQIIQVYFLSLLYLYRTQNLELFLLKICQANFWVWYSNWDKFGLRISFYNNIF
jgi:hypothetical protein